MERFDAIISFGDAALLVGLSSLRITVAFLLLPLFSPDVVPAMVRNAIGMSMGVMVLALQPVARVSDWQTFDWLRLSAREALIGIALGFGLAAFLWAFTAAGQIVDTKAGMSNTQLSDPTSGQQVSVSGAFLGRLTGYLFMATGGFTLFTGMLLDSFRLWPLASTALTPKAGGVALFEWHLGNFMSLSFLMAAPTLVVMFAVDMVLGLINRFAPQLQLSAVSASVKGLASTAIGLLMLGTVAEGFGDAARQQIGNLLPHLARIIGP